MSNESSLKLSSELAAKAEKELNEKSEWLERDISALKDLIQSNKTLRGCMDDDFLLRFLRARKFDYERAFSLYFNYYFIRRENPEVFTDFKPSAIQPVLQRCITSILPGYDDQGRRVLLFRPGMWDPDEMPNTLLLKANLICVESILSDPTVQVNGIIIVVDLNQFGWRQANQFGLNFARKAARFMQDTTPVRVKEIHFIHEPTVFSYTFAILRPFLKEKIQKRSGDLILIEGTIRNMAAAGRRAESRVSFVIRSQPLLLNESQLYLHGSSIENLLKHVPARLLPNNIGLQGSGPKLPNEDSIISILQSEEAVLKWNEFSMDDNATAPVPQEHAQSNCIPNVYKGEQGDG